MKRVLIGAVVGGLVLFVWQFAAWMFLGLHDVDPEPKLADEAAVVAALEGNEAGVYWIPYLSMAEYEDEDSPARKEWEKKHEEGPLVWINYEPQGAPAMNAKQMAIGGFVDVLIVLVVALLLNAAGLHGPIGRFLFVSGFGVFLALAMDVQNWNWMNHPASWTRGFVIDHIGGMALVGVVLALIVKPADHSPLPE